LRVEAIAKRYGPIEAVRAASFAVAAGEVFGLLGPNGAGKTSTIAMIATQRRPSAGDAFVFGHSVTREVAAVRRRVGVVPQEVALYPELTGRENLHFFGHMYGVAPAALVARVNELLDLAGLQPRADDRVATYSGGMKRRLNLVVGLVHEPSLILLDEPTVGVDPQSRERLFALVAHLRGRGAAVLYTTHYLEEAERLCDRLAIMDAGRIVATGTLRALLADAGCAEMIALHGLLPDADLAALRAAPGVVRLEPGPDGVTLFVRDAARVLGALQEVLAAQSGQVRIEIAPASLETLFLQLTGRELRDR
jgi:ABC-2 type transport system ATP-binding protein